MRYPLTLPPHPEAQIEQAQRVWDGRFPLDVIRFRHRRFDGTQSGLRTWELWRRGRAAAVLPYDPKLDLVVLIEQFRLPALAAGIDPVMIEIPAGLVDAGEKPIETARREMKEELGLSADRLEEIGNFLLTPGGSDEYTALYAGRVNAPAANSEGIAGHSGLATEHEDIRLRVWPAQRAIRAVVDGGIPNSVAAIALLWLAARRDWLRERWSDIPQDRDARDGKPG
ncbi:MAG: NUDIX domain-containing protein [Acetobacteraceae bacterium]|nr:NUDIX domain-containing protein [Acetobacteraceae bacterium]